MFYVWWRVDVVQTLEKYVDDLKSIDWISVHNVDNAQQVYHPDFT